MIGRPKVVAIVQARMGSTRLPGKVLRQACGAPMIAWQLAQLAKCTGLDRIVIATTGSPADDQIAEYCESHGVAVFRGSEHDVLDRYYRAALEHAADVIVRMTADCPLMDPAIVDMAVEQFLEGDFDFVANTAPPPGSFPNGMDVEVFSRTALESIWASARSDFDREHVTFAIWKHPDQFRLLRFEAPEDWSDVRMSVDYADDFEALVTTLERFNDVIPPVAELVEFMRSNYPDPCRGHVTGGGWVERSRRVFEQTPCASIERRIGSRVWDADGVELIDFGQAASESNLGLDLAGRLRKRLEATPLIIGGEGVRVTYRWESGGRDLSARLEDTVARRGVLAPKQLWIAEHHSPQDLAIAAWAFENALEEMIHMKDSKP